MAVNVPNMKDDMQDMARRVTFRELSKCQTTRIASNLQLHKVPSVADRRIRRKTLFKTANMSERVAAAVLQRNDRTREPLWEAPKLGHLACMTDSRGEVGRAGNWKTERTRRLVCRVSSLEEMGGCESESNRDRACTPIASWKDRIAFDRPEEDRKINSQGSRSPH